MGRRRMSNPLALVVLGELTIKPMHPYELSRQLKMQAKEDSIRLNAGSLYAVVNALEKRGLIVAEKTVREGRRPERTIYAITDEGRAEFEEWLSELLSTPEKEYPKFEAGLSMIGGLPPDEVADLLAVRALGLGLEIDRRRSALTTVDGKVPRVFTVEAEYHLRLLEAERAFVQELLTEIRRGTLDGLDGWRRFHDSGELAYDVTIFDTETAGEGGGAEAD